MAEKVRIVREHKQVREMSLADMLDYCGQNQLEPEKVTVSGCHMSWDRDETYEEQERRLEWEQRSDERTEKWEREAYARLKEKYGD